MAYQHSWYIKKHIVLSRYTDTMTADEMDESLTSLHDFFDQAEDSLIHLISDVSQFQHTLSLRTTMRIVRDRPPHPARGWLIIVGQESAFIRLVSEVIRRVRQAKSQDFDTLNEALEFLRHVDPSIDWSKAEGDARA